MATTQHIICEDCRDYIAADDLTGLNYHYSPETADEREHSITTGEAQLRDDRPDAVFVVADESDSMGERTTCECCGLYIPGFAVRFTLTIEDIASAASA